MTFDLFLFPGAFDGRPADYLFMLLFNWICIVVSFHLLFGARNNQLFFFSGLGNRQESVEHFQW